jgi:hypothetical protein
VFDDECSSSNGEVGLFLPVGCGFSPHCPCL